VILQGRAKRPNEEEREEGELTPGRTVVAMIVAVAILIFVVAFARECARR
jgi:hypothetical protein